MARDTNRPVGPADGRSMPLSDTPVRDRSPRPTPPQPIHWPPQNTPRPPKEE